MVAVLGGYGAGAGGFVTPTSPGGAGGRGFPTSPAGLDGLYGADMMASYLHNASPQPHPHTAALHIKAPPLITAYNGYH